ncbi:MAG TPA: phospholipid carrier-dependent glycosyltransferase [Pyrinomonadaceae bacterium]|nr:phospholipid carrier-dependent glycosyltransferase [Pyrinomonadaceae bacterium]
MSNSFRGRSKALALFLAALLPRLIGAFFLPNAFGDAYVYIQEIGTHSTKIANGTFRLTDLFGFWLPLYQVISALLNVFVRNGFYSGKIVAAWFGAGSCLLVYLITKRLTDDAAAALWMFLLIGLNPLHIFYSASAMTDIPHAFFVLAALYFVLTENWIVAALFGALAGCTRVESWMFIALIPFLQFIRTRRLSAPVILTLCAPPLFWFYISWKATGNWLACFVQRQQYHDWLLQANPAIAHFSLTNVIKDTAMLLVSSDIAVLIASFVAGWFVLRRGWRLLKSPVSAGDAVDITAPVLFFFAFLGLLTVAYLTHQQPIIFPRYGLILFTVGLPILAWTFLRVRKNSPQLARGVLIGIVTICVCDASIQLAGAVGTVNQYRAQRAAADYLRDHFDLNSEAKIFCDDGTVRVLSGIPEQRFLSSSQAPREAAMFRDFVASAEIGYLVLVNTPASNPATIPRKGESPNFESFDPVFHSSAAFLHTDIWLLKASNGKAKQASAKQGQGN